MGLAVGAWVEWCAGVGVDAMENTWVVVAESSRARIFKLDGLLTPLRELSGFVNPDARARERDLAPDRQGRTFESFGSIRHAKQQELTPKQQRSLAFARELAGQLEQGRSCGDFERLILIAPPAFLGMLRKNLSDNTRQTISREIKKNLVRENEEAIRQYLRL
jgi:protein required for attachment to host cells